MSTQRRRATRHIVAVNAEVFREFAVGQRVMTVDGIPGTITDVQDGPVPQVEAYEVVLDNNLGGGSYFGRDLQPLNEVSASVTADGTERIGGVYAVPQPVDDPNLHLASEDYPELADILVQRPPLAHSEPLRMAASKTAGAQGPLRITYLTTDASGATMVNQVHFDYYEDADEWVKANGPDTNGWIVPNIPESYVTPTYSKGLFWQGNRWGVMDNLAGPDAMLYREAAFVDTPESLALAEAAGDLLGQSNDRMAWVDVPGEAMCPTCQGRANLPEGPCPTCNGIGILYNETAASQVQAANDHVLFATSALWDRVLDAGTRYLDERIPGMETGQVWSYDWCRFRKNRTCFYPREMDLAATQQSGYAVWVPYDRGLCWRDKWEDQRACPIAEPGPKSGDPRAMVDATVSWQDGGQRAASKVDADHLFEFTASWTDVRDKARRIRTGGGVKVLSIVGDKDSGRTVTAEVKGDTHVYETSIQSEPGRKNVALWTCACPWAAYSWGRSGRWKKYEGRMCAHALALTFEAQGKDLMEVSESPDWGEDVTVMRPGDYVPPPPKAAMRAVALDPDLAIAPAVLIAHGMLASGDPERLVLTAFGSKGAAILAQAKVLDFSGRLQALVRGTIRTIKRIFTDDGTVELTDGQIVPVRDITYPTYHPTIGLTAALWDEEEIDLDAQDAPTSMGYYTEDELRSMAELREEPEPALPSTTGEEDDEGDDAADEDSDAAADDEGSPSVDQDDAQDRQERTALNAKGLIAPGLEYLAAPTDPKAARSKDAADIAAMAARFLKEGVKAFSKAEQDEIINEGEDVRAANLDSLDLDGTHYLALEEALASSEDDASWLL